MSRRISQREAHKLRRRVDELESILDGQLSAWSGAWPRGVNIETWTADTRRVKVARLLGHAVVVVPSSDEKELRFYALPLSRQRAR